MGVTGKTTQAPAAPVGYTLLAPPSRPGGRVLTVLLAAVAGLAVETAFPDRSWWPMAPVGVGLLLLALHRNSARWGSVVGTVFGLAFFLPHVWWANESVGQPIGWVALSVSQALYLGLFGGTWVLVRRAAWLRTRPWAQAIAAAVVWVAVERLRGRWPFGGFPWGTLAFSQTEGPLLHLAPVGGTALVSGAVVMVGALLALTVHNLDLVRLRPAAVAGLLAVTAVAAPQLLPLASKAESGTVRVGAVQGNVPTQGAEAMSQAREVTANHAAGTQALLARVGRGALDLVLWPESAADIDPRSDANIAATVDAAAQAIGAPILLGTQRVGPQTRYNDYILWEPGQGSAQGYTKQHPVPFGEYIPYRDFFRRLTPAVDLVTTDMAPGTGIALVLVEVPRLGRAVPITTAICFEVAYDQLIRESVLAGSELIVIPTNNASFGLTQESTQQLAMSRFRAAEHGRAVVQISTVGVSAVIGPDGAVRQRTGLFTPDQMADELPLRTSITFADRLGQWPGRAIEGLALVLLVAGAVVKDETRRRLRPGS